MWLWMKARSIRAIEADCTEDPADLRWAAALLHVQTAHRWVLTAEIQVAYLRQIHRTACRGVTSTRTIRSALEVAQSQDSSKWLDGWSVIEGDYDQDDAHVVGAAAAVAGSILITTDARLAEALLRSGVAARERFVVALLPEAARLLLS